MSYFSPLYIIIQKEYGHNYHFTTFEPLHNVRMALKQHRFRLYIYAYNCNFIAKIVKMICDIGKFYSTQMHRILKGDLEKKDKKPVLFELNDRLCVLVNNVQVTIYVVYLYVYDFLQDNAGP